MEKSLADDKAEDIAVIALAGKTDFADFMVIASGTSQRHVGAIAEHLAERLKNDGRGKVPVEGLTASDWVLVDAGDVLVHIFRPEARSFYDIEKLWNAPPMGEERAGKVA